MADLSAADQSVKEYFGAFIREFNRRERTVRVSKTHTFKTYYSSGEYRHRAEWGTGWVVDGDPVPYFHPNRSFHDEVIWLNKNLFYDPSASFEDRLVNAAVVKFYGPSRTLELATRGTGCPYVRFGDYRRDPEYRLAVLSNIERASAAGERLWGTTELRTSLQTAARDYARAVPSPLDHRVDPERKMRPSDMVHWVASLAEGWAEFYSRKPTMRESFEMLTSHRGIGNYYGYHFSSNLARMPEVGSPTLIEAEHSERFAALGVKHGNLDENDDYVVAGPGALATLTTLFPDKKMNSQLAAELICAIRDSQEDFFGISSSRELDDLRESTELGRYTTFGVEIACCQFHTFRIAAIDRNTAKKRSKAPISVEVEQPGDEGGVFD